jgi:hypothetical protein
MEGIMRPSRSLVALCLAASVSLASLAQAQQPAPHIGYVVPAGGQQGASFQVKVGGQFLDGVRSGFVSGSGVQVTVVEHVKPPTQGQFNQLREKLQELMKKEKKDAETWKEIGEIRKKMATFVRRPASPAIAETVTLQLKILPDAKLGERELRLTTPTGLTNPLVFCVGQHPEFSEKDLEADAARSLALPAVINGQIAPAEGRVQGRQSQQFTPGDVDRFHFEAHRGQQLVVAASARQLVPFLADAVPGWFQATLALYDAAGNEVAYDDDYRFHPDPVLVYRIPKDGQYVLEIKDSIYRGRADFVYRITLGELPFVTSIFPLGGRADTVTAVELKGWNLPLTRLTMDAHGKEPGIQTLSVPKGTRLSNSVPFAVDTLPECLDKEPNNSPDTAQAVTLPMIVNGRIDAPGDWDVFRIDGRAGDQLVAEVLARRLDSPVDSVLRLTDAAGQQLAFNDDHEDKGSGLNTHHADSLLRFTLPASGTYYLHLGDAQNKGGEEYAYRLRISEPRPDFELRVAPSSITVRGGMSAAITVYALRKDGFSGAISLGLKDVPKGFTLSGGLIPAGQEQVRVTLSAPPTPTEEPVRVSVEGRATIGRREVVRTAVPADDLMQAFAYRHLVPANDLMVAVARRFNKARAMGKTARRGGEDAWMKLLDDETIQIPAGGTAQVRVALPSIPLKDQIQFELNEPPDGISIEEVSPRAEGLAIRLHSDAAKAKPGLAGNLIVTASLKRPAAADKAKPRANKQRISLGALPAIPFEVVQP